MFIVLRWRASLLLSLKPENDCFGHEMYKIRYLPIFAIEIVFCIVCLCSNLELFCIIKNNINIYLSDNDRPYKYVYHS
jgi:hypothetical protein